MGEKTSRLRQRLRRSGEQYARQLELAMEEEGPLVRGSFTTRERTCGKPSCRCTRGELHRAKYLVASQGGKLRQVYVPAADEVMVAAGVERYRRLRDVRARLEDLAQEQLELLDQLGRSLLARYPPDDPFPPALHAGPRPRGGRRGGR